MRFDDDSSTPPTEGAGELPARSRRRAARPWSNPASADRAAPERPASDTAWSSPGAVAGSRPPIAPPLLPALGAPEAAAVDLTPVLDQLSSLQAQVAALQAAGAAPVEPPEGLTGAELAAAIEGLGNALGGGMATLLTEHRNLLARDVTQSADRILEEVGIRLRAATTQTVDSVEERIRHVVARALADVSEQLELRLDKVQTDVTGLRAVMLEIPDQTAVTERLDTLAETIASNRNRSDGRTSPAVTAAIERSVAAPLGRVEDGVRSIAEVVRELLDERLPEDLAEVVATAVSAGADSGLPDAATLEALTAEITALRRRIALRPGGIDAALAEPEPETEPDGFDELEIEVERPAPPVVSPPPPPATRTTGAAKSTKAASRGRRSRRID